MSEQEKEELEAGEAAEDLNEKETGEKSDKADKNMKGSAAEKEAEEAPADEAGETPADEAGSESGDEKEHKPDKDKKKKKSDKKTDALQTRIEELEDRVKRQMAEFDNFRKRTEKEKNAMFETGAKSVIEKILPVVDNFERGLATVPEEETTSPFAEGMNMIYKQLIDELDKMDVHPIEAVGHEFDPELHNAVSQVESEEYESGYVASEFQKGYTYRGTVVRHSMVAVVQ